MRSLSDAEMLSLTELLQMDTNALTKIKAAKGLWRVTSNCISICTGQAEGVPA